MQIRRKPEREKRIEVSLEAQLTNSDGVRLPVTFKDLSRRGFKVEHAGADLNIGEIVMIGTSRSDARAQLHWVTADEAGGTFIDDVEGVFH
ncbi:PilZ domain-containing protein [Sphingomonas sp. F9_3S_D5_B_2]